MVWQEVFALRKQDMEMNDLIHGVVRATIMQNHSILLAIRSGDSFGNRAFNPSQTPLKKHTSTRRQNGISLTIFNVYPKL